LCAADHPDVRAEPRKRRIDPGEIVGTVDRMRIESNDAFVGPRERDSGVERSRDRSSRDLHHLARNALRREPRPRDLRRGIG